MAIASDRRRANRAIETDHFADLPAVKENFAEPLHPATCLLGITFSSRSVQQELASAYAGQGKISQVDSARRLTNVRQNCLTQPTQRPSQPNIYEDGTINAHHPLAVPEDSRSQLMARHRARPVCPIMFSIDQPAPGTSRNPGQASVAVTPLRPTTAPVLWTEVTEAK